jgi:hypothetical protein
LAGLRSGGDKVGQGIQHRIDDARIEFLSTLVDDVADRFFSLPGFLIGPAA